MSADGKKQTNQNDRRPKVESQGQSDDQGPLQRLGSAVGGAAKAAQSWAGPQDSASQSAPNPLDWAREFESDASTVWGWARQAYKAVSGTYDDGVSNLYAGQDARSKIMQKAAEFGAYSVPLVEMGQAMSDADTLRQAATGQITDEQRKQEQDQSAEQSVKGAPGGAIDSLSMILPGSWAGRVAGLGIPLAESLLGGDQDEQETGLAWAGVGALLSFGRVPAPLRKVITDRFEGFGELEEGLTEAVDSKRLADINSPNPGQRAQAVKDWITEQVNRGAMPAEYGKKPVAKAVKAGAARQVVAEVGPEGSIKLLESEGKKNLKKLLSRVGVDSIDELVDKVQNEGLSDPKAVKAVIQNWKDLNLGYDLKRYHPEETPLRDPRRLLESLGDQQQAGFAHVNAVNHYLDQIHSGLFANASNPMRAVLRALAGHNRGTQLTHQQYLTSIVKLLGEEGLGGERQKLLMRAAEGDEEAYSLLKPHEQMVVDSWGLVRAATRQASEGTDYAKNFVPNWVPRTDREAEEMTRGRGRPSRASVLARESRAHREQALRAGPGGQLVLGQRFTSVNDANQALAGARSNLVATLTTSDRELSAELLNDPEARAIRRLRDIDPAEALRRAKVMAAQKYPDKETNFLLNVNRVLGNQVRAIHTHQALGEFTRMLTSDGRAAALKAESNRQREEFIRQGYQTIDDPRFRGHVFHPDLAKDLNRYVNHVGKGLRDAPVWKQALALEGRAVAAIMFSPLVHGLNVAGRMGMAAMMNPLEFAAYVGKGSRHVPAHELDDLAWSLKSEAFNAGVTPHFVHQNYADSLLSNMQDALGDVEDRLPSGPRPDTRANRMRQFIDNRPRPLQGVNNYFWGKVNDFGVAMYHVEKAGALKAGMAPEAAAEYAARRANSWMGTVAPEDTNPMLHDLSRLVMFAPNWWRTWGELMVPLYKRAGFTQDPAYARYAAYQGGKTIAAALAFQKLTGNALNYALSGHLQNENQPGSHDKLEISRPEILGTLKDTGLLPATIDPSTGIDAKTGGRYTLENPLARQQQAVEGALGLQSGQPDWQTQDLSDGLTRFLASRISPLFDSAMGAMNVDVYQSVRDGQLRAVNPEQRAMSLSPANLLYGALMMIPSGQDFAAQVNQKAAQGDTTPVDSVLGTRIPRSLQEAVADVKDPAGRVLFSALTGMNPAYDTAQRTRGQKPSDQDYQRAKQLTDEYHKQMTVLSAQALSGQMTPAQWRQAYQDAARSHAAQMEALYKGSPDYVNGAEGMAAQWEALYDKSNVLRRDGTIDYDQLASEQAKFTANHSSDQMQQMNAYLSQNDTAYPMLALYHKTQKAFDDWQSRWALQHNVDVSQLRKETSEYGALYGDNQGSRRYLSQHPELRAYETAKRREFDRTTQGVMHSLFYGQNATVVQYLRSHRLTQSQFASQEATAA